MAQDNRHFLKLVGMVNEMLDKHAIRDLYSYMLKDRAELLRVEEYKPNHYSVVFKTWTEPNINFDCFPKEIRLRLKPNDD